MTAKTPSAGALRIAAVPALVAVTTAAFAPSASAASYTVKPGDTLSKVAFANGLSLTQLLALNKLSNPNLIFPGQTLQLSAPKAAAAAPTAAKTQAAAKAAAQAPAAAAKVTYQYVDVNAGFGTWKVWNAAKQTHYIQGTGAQANVYINVFVATGDKAAARAASGARALGATTAAAPAAAAASSTVAKPAATTAPAVATKKYVSDSAGFQTWKVWNAAGVSHFFQGTGAQANAYINVFVATGDKAAARAAAAKLGPLTAPAPAVATPAVQTPAATPAVAKPAVATPSVATPAVSATYTTGSVQALVAQIAKQHGVDPALALAFAEQESSFQTNAVSSAGALGVMQIMPANQAWLSGMAGRSLNLLNPVDNITAGVLMIKYLLATSSSRDNAIASYYQGQGAVQMYGWYADTRVYVASINARYAKFAG